MDQGVEPGPLALGADRNFSRGKVTQGGLPGEIGWKENLLACLSLLV